MHRRLLPPLALSVLALTILLPAQAFNPSDDDAGSGRDAGDRPSDAVSLLPGTYQGRFDAQIDRTDFYAFQAQAGQAVTLSITGTHSVFMDIRWSEGQTDQRDGGPAFGSSRSDEPATYLIPYTGLWHLRTILLASGISGPVTYEFSLTVENAEHAAWSVAPSGWQVLEAAWDQPNLVRWLYRVDFGRDATDPYSAMVLVETWRDGKYGRTSLHLWRSAFGRWVVASDPPLPTQELSVRAEANPLGEFTLVSDGVVATNGAIRLSFHRTGTVSPGVLWVMAEGPITTAAASGSDLVLWNQTSPAQTPHVVAPGAAVSGARNLDLPLAARFVGFFTPHGSPANVTDPDGNRVPLLSYCGCLWLIHPTTGTWTFAVGGQATVGLASVKNYLDGAFLPDHGVAPVA